MIRPLTLLCLGLLLALSSSRVAAQSSEEGLEESLRSALALGRPEEVVRIWEQAAWPTTSLPTTAILDVATAYESTGRPDQAAIIAELSVSDEMNRGPADLARLHLAAARARLYFGPPDRVADHLAKSEGLARELGDDRSLAIRTFLSASLHEGQRNHSRAFDGFVRAAEGAEKANAHLLAAQARVNAARVSQHRGDSAKAVVALVEQAEANLSLAQDRAGNYRVQLAAGSVLTELLGRPDDAPAGALERAYALLNAGRAGASRSGDRRAIAEAHAAFAKLYRSQNRREEADQLLQRAISDANSLQAFDLLYRFQWDYARSARDAGDLEAAMTAYQSAIRSTEVARVALTNRFPSAGRSRFQEEVAPLFLEAAELLLGERKDGAPEARLRSVRSVMERLRAAELTDYFQDDCVEQLARRQIDIDKLAQDALIVYPIALENRLELLVTSRRGLERFSVDVSRAELTRVARRFRVEVQDPFTRQYLAHARELYGWLVAPIADLARTVEAQTIVFVPDPAIRTIPLAALHDGERFLIEEFSVAISPGLTLTDAGPLVLDRTASLLAGVSVARHGLPALPAAREELIAIQEILGGELLVDDDFAVEAMGAILEKQDIGIIHISSHGVLSGSVKDSYVAAYDRKLDMDTLTRLIGSTQYRERPVELLTLSACSTAAGDDRAALGMAGLAIKAGARSALASLWEIPDVATSRLMVDFYRGLKRPGVSKAEALRTAQLEALSRDEEKHPVSWSAFILISNWL